MRQWKQSRACLTLTSGLATIRRLRQTGYDTETVFAWGSATFLLSTKGQ